MVSYLAIILLVTWEQNYLLALGIGTVTEVVLNIWISWYVEQKLSVFAPAEKRKEHIVSDEKNCKRSEKPVYSRISEKMLYCTDNLIIPVLSGSVR